MLTNEIDGLDLGGIPSPLVTFKFTWGINRCILGIIGVCVLFRALAFISLKL